MGSNWQISIDLEPWQKKRKKLSNIDYTWHLLHYTLAQYTLKVIDEDTENPD